MSVAKSKVAKVATVEGKVQKMKLMELVQRTIMCKFFRAGGRVETFTFHTSPGSILACISLFSGLCTLVGLCVTAP